MPLFQLSLEEYLRAVAAGTPTPGGGSVSAVAAANAAAMVGMVANLTLGKRGYETAWDEARGILADLEGDLRVLAELAERDMEAFRGLMAAWRLPAASEEEKRTREESCTRAVQAAAQVPLEMARACLRILRRAARLAPIGNKTALSDVGVGVYLAEASLQAALLTLDVNLSSLRDQTLRDEFVRERDRLVREAVALKDQTLAAVSDRLKSAQ